MYMCMYMVVWIYGFFDLCRKHACICFMCVRVCIFVCVVHSVVLKVVCLLCMMCCCCDVAVCVAVLLLCVCVLVGWLVLLFGWRCCVVVCRGNGCGRGVALLCGTLTPPSPCGHPKRLRVYTQKCVGTCARGAGTHTGTFLNVHTEAFWMYTRSPDLLTKFCPRRVITFPRGSPKKPLNLAQFKLENRSNTARSRFL